MFGVAVGLGVDVGVAVSVGIAVFVEVGLGVSVGTGGAKVEHADKIRSSASRVIAIVGMILCFIFPPLNVIVTNQGYDISFSQHL
jgi:hypothetical protein